MRFISLSQGFKKTVKKGSQKPIQNPDGSTEMREISKPIIAFFRQGGATQREKRLALERFKFTGLSERENPTTRLSIYDTDEEARANGWDASLKSEIEANLVAGQNQYYFKVENEPTPKPWPAYDEADPALIPETAALVGVSFDQVIAYELENAKRPEVIAALQGVDDEEDAEVEVTA